MLNQEATDRKINKVIDRVAIDKLRRQEVSLKKKPKLIGFRQFLQRRAMAESIMRTDVADSLMATLPRNASPADLNDVMQSITLLTRAGDVTICAVAIQTDDR